jgi:hypothetical protein
MRIFFVLMAAATALSADDLAIRTASPEWRQASVGRPWALRLETAGAQGAVEWSTPEGTLPPGVHLVEASMVMLGAQPGAVLYGAPAEAGSYWVLLRATDADAQLAETWMEIRVSLLRLKETSTLAMAGQSFEWRPEAVEGVAPFTVKVPPAAYLPLGLTMSEDGVLAGVAPIPGRYEVPLELTDAGGNTLRTTVDVTVYGAETTLLPVGVRLTRDACRVTAEWTPVPEGTEVRVFGGEADVPLEVEVTNRESGERVTAVYSWPACSSSGPQP